MTRRSILGMTLAFGLLGLVLGLEAKAADTAKAAGTWTWTFQRPNGGDAIEVTLKLKQDGDKLTGTITGPGGNETEIKDGKVKGDEVSFDVVRERDGNTFTTKYLGTLTGDSIKGTAKSTFNGNERSRDWEAKRKAS